MNDNLKEEFIEVVKNWVKIDDEIREINFKLKELKNEKKEFENYILAAMDELNESVINITDGKLRKNTSNSKGPLKEEHIQNAIFEYSKDSIKSVELTKYILNSRQSTVRNNLKRTKNRTNNKKDLKNN